MRYLGLDLGTKTLGIAITDKTNTIVSPLTTVRFNAECYDEALKRVLDIINEKDIDKVILGFPKNMDGSIGFAGNRSLNFKELLEKEKIKVYLQDERLTTIMAENVIHDNNENVKNTKNKIDAIAASIILDDYLKGEKNDDKK